MIRQNHDGGREKPRLYVVALSHLDTQWRWTERQTVTEFLPRTARENEERFRRFPGYVLSFEGARRYRLLEECHPAWLETVRLRVREGRWFPAGAAWEAFDANLPAAESIVRQILLGRRELERVVGQSSDDLFLPDCFGFPRSLPTIAAHCGIVGFSTQKLRRGAEMRAAFGIPFPLGRWRGPDGSEILAVLDPGEYGAQTRSDLANDDAWRERFEGLARAGWPQKLQTYQGLGDKGGAIPAETVEWLERSMASPGPLEVLVTASQQLYRDLTPAERSSLPVHDGDLLLRLHATGCYTSRSQLKRWHRATEALALSAECASTLASPVRSAERNAAGRDALRANWERLLSRQMHDDLTGTSIPAAYRFSAAGLADALNGFARQLEDAVEQIAGELDTDTEGEPLAVFNPLSYARRERVEIREFLSQEKNPPAIFDPCGREVPSQWRSVPGGFRGCFDADLPPLSVSIFEAKPGRGRLSLSGASSGTRRELENEAFSCSIDERGDLASWIDRRSGLELLGAPAGVELLENRSERFPSWEIRYEDVRRAPRSRLAGTPRFEWIENGPLRQRLRVHQAWEGSNWIRDYVLDSGLAGLEVDCRVDWRTAGTLAKAAFPLSWEFPEAIYDLGIGVARRPIASPEQYEVPAQGFVAAPFDAATAANPPRAGGVAILSDVKQGWDHPDPSRLRLSLLHSPRIGRRFRYQRHQDLGAHRFRVGLDLFPADNGLSRLAELGNRFRQPVVAFRLQRGSGGASRVWEALSVQGEGVAVAALKPAECGDGVILRLRETEGSLGAFSFRSSRFVIGEELDGGERRLDCDAHSLPDRPLTPFSLRTLACRRREEVAIADTSLPMPLAWNVHAVGDPGTRPATTDGGLDGRGRMLPRPLLPKSLAGRGVVHDLSHLHLAGRPSALRCAGQRLSLPPGFRRLVLLAGSFGKASDLRFEIAGRSHEIRLPDGFEDAGRFDELAFLGRLLPRDSVRAGYFRAQPLALSVPHRLNARGTLEPCRAVRLFEIALVLSGDGDELVLPSAPSALLFAATSGVAGLAEITPLAPLFEDERAVP